MPKIILVSFGGPRSLEEVPDFLRELLCDQEMIRTPLPLWLHHLLFSWIARMKAPELARRYAQIGGKSPIFEDTERLAARLPWEVIPFYRYLPATHASFLERLRECSEEELVGITLYPQYSETTTGASKRWIESRVGPERYARIRWIDSYATHPAFIKAWVEQIGTLLKEKGIEESEATLLFSAHSIPQAVVDQGDVYQKECEASFREVAEAFPRAHTLLAYQSEGKRGRWIGPSTRQVCSCYALRKEVVVVPIAFTTDHIETLYEIEYEYFPVLRKRGLLPHRCSVPNFRYEDIIDIKFDE